MSSFDWEKSFKDSIQDGLNLTVATAANVKSLKASIDATDIMELVGSICRGVLVKGDAVYKKWINE